MAEGSAANLPAHSAYCSQIKLLEGRPRIAAKPPADFIGHPVSYSREDRLVEEKSFEGRSLATGS
jgi:hypothetical protein